MYAFALLILKLIVVYFLFAVLKSIVTDYWYPVRYGADERVFNLYVVYHLLALFLSLILFEYIRGLMVGRMESFWALALSSWISPSFFY